MSDNKINGVTKQCPWAPDNGVGQRCVSPPSVTRGLVFLWLGPVGFFYVIQKAQRPALAIAPGPRPSPANTSRSGHGPLSPGAAIWVPHTIPSDCDIRVQAIRVACVYIVGIAAPGDSGPKSLKLYHFQMMAMTCRVTESFYVLSGKAIKVFCFCRLSYQQSFSV